MSYRIIHNMLNDLLDQVPNIPTVTRENINNAGCDGYNVRTTLLPARTETASLGLTGADRFYGLFQIDLIYPQNEGSDAADYMADAIISFFKKGAIHIQDGIELRVVNHWREVSPDQDQKYTVPVIIEWESFIFRTG